MTESTNAFCLMLIEEFLMRKNMRHTLDAFRSEWSRPEDEDLLLVSWQQICLKLRIERAESKGQSLIENLVNTLIEDASWRTRQQPAVIVEGLATLPRLRPSGTAATSLDETAEQMEMLLTRNPSRTSVPPRSPKRNNEKPKGSSKAAKKQLKKLHEDIVVDTYGKPKISSENWIPEPIRFRSIERDIAVAKANLKDSMVLEAEREKEMKRLSQNELHRAQVEEKLGSKKKVNCACCNFLYSHINLTLKVSMKAITDLRKKWVNGKPNGYADPDGAKVGNVPRCYNEVAVCRFCAQFFRDQTMYRPSFDDIAYEERKEIFFETRRLEKEYWDPLKMCAKDEERRRLENEENLKAGALEHASFESGEDHAWDSGSEATMTSDVKR